MKLVEAARKCSPKKGITNWKKEGYMNYRNCVAIEMAKSNIDKFTFEAIYSEGYNNGFNQALPLSELEYDRAQEQSRREDLY